MAAGAPAVGIKAKDGVVLATEKKHKSILVEEHSIIKVEVVTDHIGMVYSGELCGCDRWMSTKRHCLLEIVELYIYN